MNIDIILNNCTFDFKKSFLDCIICQTNHLKKNIKFEKNLSKKIEILAAIILTGLVFKEYEENYNLGIKEIENLIKNFFDKDFLTKVAKEFPDLSKMMTSTNYNNKNEHRYAIQVARNLNLKVFKYMFLN